MAGYRGDGYGQYGDHGDDHFYDDMEGGQRDRMRDRDPDRFSSRDDWRNAPRGSEGGGMMFGGDRQRPGGRGSEGMMDRAGERVRTWLRDDDDQDHRAHGQRDEQRGQGFLERSGHQMRSRTEDQGGGGRSTAPLGLHDRSRAGGGMGTDRGNPRFSAHGQHDHYLSWREQQMAELDRDYDEYCRENEQKFSSEFENWRQSRRQGSSGASAMSQQPPIAGSSSYPSPMTASAADMGQESAFKQEEEGNSTMDLRDVATPAENDRTPPPRSKR